MSKLTVKWQHNGEFRRFTLDKADYEELLKKVRTFVPDFKGKMAWKDVDGDEILLTSNAEFQEAVRDLKEGQILRLHTLGLEMSTPLSTPRTMSVAEETPVVVEEKKEEEEEEGEKKKPSVVHAHVVCDSCDAKGIEGVRFKCLVCADYDLCAKCEAAGVHADTKHTMIRIVEPNDQSWRWMAGFGHGHHSFPGRRHHGHHKRHGGFWMPPGCPMGPPPFGPTGPPPPPGCPTGTPPPPFTPGAFFHQYSGMNPEMMAKGNCPWGPKGKSKTTTSTSTKTTTTSADATEKLGETMASGVQFLQNVGEQVAAALSNLGIDVDIDVEHNGKTEKIHVPKEKEKEEEVKEQKVGEQEEKEKKVPTAPEATDADKSKKSAEAAPEAASEAAAEGGQQQQEWTFVEQNGEQQVLYPTESLQNMAEGAANTATSGVQHTLQHLQAMGFDNQGGWLTRLVEAKKGDINEVLNTLTRKHNRPTK